MVSQAADSLDWTTPICHGLEPNRMVVNMYREQGNYRAGLYQEIWTENRQPVGFSATREDREDRDKAGLWCQWQLQGHQAYQGKMLEAITQVQSMSTGIHVHPLCHAASGSPTVRSTAATLLHWGESAEDTRMSLLLLTRGRGAESRTENPVFQRTSDSLLVGNCGEICFYRACFYSLETKT